MESANIQFSHIMTGEKLIVVQLSMNYWGYEFTRLWKMAGGGETTTGEKLRLPRLLQNMLINYTV